MAKLTITIEDNPDQEDIHTVISQLVEYNNNNSQAEKDAYQPLAILI